MIDVLAVSHACATAVNRTVYRDLARRGWNVELVIPRALGTHRTRRADPARAGDPPLHLLELRGDNPRLYGFDGLRAVLTRRRPRLVLLDNDPASRLSLEIGIWAKLHGAKLVCLSCENQSQRWGAIARRTGVRGLMAGVVKSALTVATRSRVAEVFVISSAGVMVQQEQGYSGRITQIPVGFDPALFRPDPKARAAVRERLGLKGVTVAYFGRMCREKGVHLLVEALSTLAARDVDFQLLLDVFEPGGGTYEHALIAQIKAGGLDERMVRFTAAHDEMPRYMNAADIVVLPSISTPQWVEQYGRVAPEAMACGRTVIAAQSGALPELVGDAGVTFPEGDVPALTAILEALIVDPVRRDALGEAATKRAHERLSVDQQVDITERVVRRLVGGPEAKRSS